VLVYDDASVEAAETFNLQIYNPVNATIGNNLAIAKIIDNDSPLPVVPVELPGSSGNDVILGTALADLIKGTAGIDYLDGRGGNDVLNGGLGDDFLVGGTGSDTADYSDATAAVKVSLALLTAQNTGAAGLDTLAGIENLTGSAFKDVLSGDGLANVLTGGAGNDSLSGQGGIDSLFGEDGNDILDGGAGVDTMTGGIGNDIYIIDSLSDIVVENVGGGSDTVKASFDLTITYANVENLGLLGSANLNATGDGGNNTLTGNSGNNILTGAGGQDKLLGLGGNDILMGGAGKDTLTGGLGSDELYGGSLDKDVFVYKLATESGVGVGQHDTIHDFDAADQINLSGIDADAVSVGNQIFVNIGSAAFTALGQMRIQVVGPDTLIQANVSGDTTPDFEILLSGWTGPIGSTNLVL